MKSTREQKLKSLGTDESIGVQEFDNSCRKEKKEKTKKIEIDTGAMMTSNEGRVGEKQKSGKKGHKEDTEDAIACKEEKVKKKKTKDNAMIHDDDKGQAENQQKKKKKSKKDKKDAILNGYEDERETEKRKKKKKDHRMSFDKETGVKHTKEEETAVVEGKDERNVERKKEKMDATKADKKEKKRKEKKTKDDIAAGDEEHKKKVKEKKQNVKEIGDEVEGGKEANGGKEKKKKEKRRKEKLPKDDMEVGDEEQKKKVKEKKENVAILKGNHSGNKAQLLEGKQDKGKKRKMDKDDSVGKANSEGQGKQDKGKKRKMDKDDIVGKANSEGQTTIKKAIAADSSKHPKPKSKKVEFADEVEVFPPADLASESNGTEDGLVRGKRFTKEEDEMIRKAVFDYIESRHLGEEGLDMILHVRKHTKLMYCWNEIAAALPWRPVMSVYSRGHVLFERGDGNKWTPEELELIRTSREKYGAKWKAIADDMGKFRIHVKDAYRRHKSAHLNRGHWSQEEIQTLFELVNKDLQMKLYEEKKSKHGMLRDNISWEAIGNELGTRRFVACCQKWYSQLTSPMVADGTWADADDYRLVIALVDLDASCEEEVDWDYLLEHRSGDVCRRRWKQMVNHLGEHGNKSFSEQVEVLSKRYCPDLLQVRETLDARPTVD